MPIEVSNLRSSITEYAQKYKGMRERREKVLEKLCAQVRKEGAHDFSARREPESYALIAVDGSQIMPSRHQPIFYAYIQVACVGWTRGTSSGSSSFNLRKSHLLGEEELIDAETGEPKPANWITSQRDILETELLAEAAERARKEGYQPVLVADNSLIPYDLLMGRLKQAQKETQLKRLRAAFERMQRCGALLCGYIDRPNATVLARKYAERLQLEYKPGLFDRDLLARTLPPLHRIDLHDPGWEINKLLGQDEQVLAFYANFSEDALHPIIARIEVPAWCADQIDDLCAVLHVQVRLGRDYPFVLEAAHTEAVVTKADQRALEKLLRNELMASGITLEPSAKQMFKEESVA